MMVTGRVATDGNVTVTFALGEHNCGVPKSQILYSKVVTVPLKFGFAVKLKVPSAFNFTFPSGESSIRFAIIGSLSSSKSLGVTLPVAEPEELPATTSSTATGALLEPSLYFISGLRYSASI